MPISPPSMRWGRAKAHTRESDAIAAARRRLPMTEIDAVTPLVGPDGPTTLLAAFVGRRMLLAYCFMWRAGRTEAEQCEGCTFFTNQMRDLTGVHSRDVTYDMSAPFRQALSERDRT